MSFVNDTLNNVLKPTEKCFSHSSLKTLLFAVDRQSENHTRSHTEKCCLRGYGYNRAPLTQKGLRGVRKVVITTRKSAVRLCLPETTGNPHPC